MAAESCMRKLFVQGYPQHHSEKGCSDALQGKKEATKRQYEELSQKVSQLEEEKEQLQGALLSASGIAVSTFLMQRRSVRVLIVVQSFKTAERYTIGVIA